MCFVLLALNQHPEYPFILAANRDEYYARPALPMQEWEDEPSLLGGRDLQAMGAWLALNQHSGRIALVTNVRQGLTETAGRSRGQLVRDLLLNPSSLPESLQALATQQDHYAGFNLLAGTAQQMYYFSNRNQQPIQPLAAGIHALSNASLNTPWPKVQRGKQQLQSLLQQADASLPERLFALLADTTVAEDAQLPDTGIGLENERWLSPLFISSEHYGTRCSTLILVDSKNRVRCYERSFPKTEASFDRRFSFQLQQSTQVKT